MARDEDRAFERMRQRLTFWVGLGICTAIAVMYLFVAPIMASYGRVIPLPSLQVLAIVFALFGGPVIGLKGKEMLLVLQVIFPWLPKPSLPAVAQPEPPTPPEATHD